MRHLKTIQLLGSTALTLKGEADDPADMVTKAIGDLTKTVETKMGEFGTRIDRIEAKANRPDAGDKKADEPSVERKAFAEYLKHGENLIDTEKKTLTVSSDPGGGYLAPPEISAEIIRDLHVLNPIRAFAGVRGTTSPSVIYPTRGDLTNARWHGETETTQKSDITFGQVEIHTRQLSTYVDISDLLLQDAPAAEAEVRLALAEDFALKEGYAFLWGNGQIQPEGLMVNEKITTVPNGHATNLAPDALIKLLYSLPAAYRNIGAWAMNGTTLGIVRTLKDGDGRFLWQPSFQLGQPETILGRPVIEMVDMPDIASAAQPIIYGDFSGGYRILDRLGMAVKVDNLTQATRNITRIHATRRVGGGVIQPARFRKLVMATS